MLEIITAPNPVLSQKSKPVKKIDKGILDLISEMEKALEKATDPVGVGLAAPQVGKSLRIFIVKPGVNSKISVFINPKITNQKGKLSKAKSASGRTRKLEGCLSLQNIWGEVLRFNQITLEYLDSLGKKRSQKFNGFMATIIQHEIDHLNGILFPKRVLEQNGTLYKSEKDEENQDIFEEIKI